MQTGPILDLDNYSTENPFLQQLIDTAAGEVTQMITGKMVPSAQEEEQRRVFIQQVSNLPCLVKRRRTVGVILNHLEAAKTNREFLSAIQKVGELIQGVRESLRSAQVLDDSRDPFGPIQLRKSVTEKPVSVLDIMAAKTKAVEEHSSILFLNRVLPLLGDKFSEVRIGAYSIGDGVYHGDVVLPHDPDDGAENPQSVVSSPDTNVEKGIWRGVQFRDNSTGRALLKLCSEYKLGDTIERRIFREALYPGESITDKLETNLDMALYNILKKFDDSSKPFKRMRGRGDIKILGQIDDASPLVTEKTSTPMLNEVYLDQPLNFSSQISGCDTEFTIEMIDDLKLSAHAETLLQALMKDEGKTMNVSKIFPLAEQAMLIESLITEVHEKIVGKTSKIIHKVGASLCFAKPD